MALNTVLGQALSRNKAHEKVDLWKEREIQDKGSRCTISLKSRKGDVVRQVTKVPEGAEVTSNVVNQFEIEREENAAKKEDELLARLANGKDPAWRPDQYLSQLKGKGPSKLKLRPQDYLRMDPELLQKVVAEYKAQKKAAKKKKKKKHKKEKRAVKKDKKNKTLAKAKKRDKRCTDTGEGIEDTSRKGVKNEHHEVKQKRRKRILLDDTGQPTGKEELEVLEVRSKITVSRKKHIVHPVDEASVAEARACEIASKLRKQASLQPTQKCQASPSTGSISSSGSSSSENEMEEVLTDEELEEDSITE